ncbi:MAG: hypothetical protein E6K76_10210 [Candidatus Eisenbacteria bacterium]|uniref:Uncharacterized protein n=1 Tax=Eiseniibacteriota bacterium TaxID=2212470 RepID=A0A538T1N2_UNCEI|nr:MAG: hypothetical protein E6K76_10210 [Candidatus Eisenbacteria bacterium]
MPTAKSRSVARNGGVDRSWSHVPITPGRVPPTLQSLQSRDAHTTLSMPACLQAALIPLDHEDESSSQLTLKGGLVLGGLGAELIFDRGYDSAPLGRMEVTTKTTLVPAGECFEFELQQLRSPLQGDTVAWVQVRDGEGNPLTDELFLGRLNRGYRVMDPRFTTLVDAETFISPISCGTQLKSDLTLTGAMTFVSGVSARIVLRRRRGPLWWSRPPDGVFDLGIVRPGQRILFPAQPVWAGDHGGSLRSLLFLNGEGEPIGEEHLLESAISPQ